MNKKLRRFLTGFTGGILLGLLFDYITTGSNNIGNYLFWIYYTAQGIVFGLIILSLTISKEKKEQNQKELQMHLNNITEISKEKIEGEKIE